MGTTSDRKGLSCLQGRGIHVKRQAGESWATGSPSHPVSCPSLPILKFGRKSLVVPIVIQHVN